MKMKTFDALKGETKNFCTVATFVKFWGFEVFVHNRTSNTMLIESL